MMDKSTFALVDNINGRRRFVFVTEDAELITNIENLAKLEYPPEPESLGRLVNAVLYEAVERKQRGDP